MTELALEVIERDEAGNLTATYVESSNARPDSSSRVDLIWPKSSKSLLQKLLDVFLPAGYPQSVTDDYLKYQIYDSLQAFSSSIAGLLSSRAVLEGVGVGDASASPTAALLLSVLQESMGRIATILFAYRLGTSLEPECKMYRLAADVFNDTAMVLDCLSPAFPKAARVLVLSLSSVLRALCGVAAGSSKASLSAHFARWGNLGELNAKDSSQETVISLLGMVVGSFIVSWITTPIATWSTLVLLLSVHLAMNHAAVRAVSMRSLNRQRASLVISSLIDSGTVLTPQEVSKRERIFEDGSQLRWLGSSKIGRCRIGASLQVLLSESGQRANHDRAYKAQAVRLSTLLRVFSEEDYVLWFNASKSTATIALRQGAAARSLLKAWTQSLLIARQASQHGLEAVAGDTALSVMEETLREANDLAARHFARLEDAGWDLQIAALEISSGSRFAVGSIESKGKGA